MALPLGVIEIHPTERNNSLVGELFHVTMGALSNMFFCYHLVQPVFMHKNVNVSSSLIPWYAFKKLLR